MATSLSREELAALDRARACLLALKRRGEGDEFVSLIKGALSAVEKVLAPRQGELDELKERLAEAFPEKFFETYFRWLDGE